METICAKCCLCYCFKLVEFGEQRRCCSCCLKYFGSWCQCGDCCDVEGDGAPFVAGDENKREDALVYLDEDKYTGEMKNDKKHGYGELVLKDGTRLKGYFVEDQFVGENPGAICTEPSGVGIETSSPGEPVAALVEESRKTTKKGARVSFQEPSPIVLTDDTEELLHDT
ncbi:uncharacterized protein [Montipora capricornis]|uniref:uncharacterized protein n=1 Tax=Montipora capricornis TaxID=246305 RepID=UPI0035F10DC5